MSIVSRSRKRQRRNFESRLKLNNGSDREIGIWKLIDIHQIPSKIDYENEFDFWCHNEQDLFLLRLRKCQIEKYFVVKSEGMEAAIYLIAEFDFENINNDVIRKILEQFENRGIPMYTLGKMNIEFKIDNTSDRSTTP